MRSSDLRHQLLIQQDMRITDELGGATITPVVFSTLYGRKLSDREAERYAGFQLQGVARVVYEVRWISGITTAMKVQTDQETLRIVGLEDPDNGRRRRLHLICERRASDAA